MKLGQGLLYRARRQRLPAGLHLFRLSRDARLFQTLLDAFYQRLRLRALKVGMLTHGYEPNPTIRKRFVKQDDIIGEMTVIEALKGTIELMILHFCW